MVYIISFNIRILSNYINYPIDKVHAFSDKGVTSCAHMLKGLLRK